MGGWGSGAPAALGGPEPVLSAVNFDLTNRNFAIKKRNHETPPTPVHISCGACRAADSSCLSRCPVTVGMPRPPRIC